MMIRCERSNEGRGTGFPAILTAAVLLMAFSGGYAWSGTDIAGRWRTNEIVIDGRNDDWLNTMTFMKKQNVSIGLANDDRFLYVCLVTGDKNRKMQLMSRGLILWIDGTAGKKKTFGIQYPLGMQKPPEGEGPGRPEDMERPDDEKRKEPPEGEREDPRGEPPDFQGTLDEMELLGPGKDDRKRMTLDDLEGVEIAMNASRELLVYEIKIPLARTEDSPFAVGAGNGQPISIGFETPKREEDEFGRRGPGGGGGGMPPGGGGGMGGIGGGHGMGGMGGGGMRGPGGGMGMGGERPKTAGTLKLWFKPNLAVQPAAVSAPGKVEAPRT